MPPKRLLRGGGFQGPGGARRKGNLPFPLLVLILVSCGLLAYNLSSWNELPEILRRLGSSVTDYNPGDHTLLGTNPPPSPPPPSPPPPSPPPPEQVAAAMADPVAQQVHPQILAKTVTVNKMVETLPVQVEPLATEPVHVDERDIATPMRVGWARSAENFPHSTRDGVQNPSSLFFAPPIMRAMPDPFEDQSPTCLPVDNNMQIKEVEGGPRPLSWIVKKEDANWPQNCAEREALCEVVKRIHQNRAVMVAVANSHAPGLQGFLDAIAALSISNFMLVAIDQALADNLKRQGVPYYFKFNKAQGNHGVSAQKFGIIRDFVEIGCSVLLSDTDVVYLQNPFKFLYGDSDIESMSDGWDNATVNGFLDPIDDPSLGIDNPQRRKLTLRVAALNSGLWYVSASRASLHLMKIMQHRMATEDVWDQSAYNMELWQPSRDDHFTAGCSVRVMSPLCFVNSKVMFRYIRHKPYLTRQRHQPVAVHANYHTDKPNKMRLVSEYYINGNDKALNACRGDGCTYPMKSVGQLEEHHLHQINDGFILSRDWRSAKSRVIARNCAVEAPWEGKLGKLEHDLQRLPAVPCGAAGGPAEQALCSLLQTLSPSKKEVIVTVADEAMLASVKVLASSLKAARVSNFLVVAADDAVLEAAHQLDLAVWPLPTDLAGTMCLAEAKWRVAGAVLRLGHAALLVDPESVFFADPFQHLYKDVDVEVATDGFDDATAYGLDHVVDDPAMGWSRYVHGFRSFARDAGMVFLQPTYQALRLTTRVAGRLAPARHADPSRCGEESGVFNEETWLPSHGSYYGTGVITRVMNYLCFSNSKGVTRFMQNDKEVASHAPVAVRLNYHPGSPGCAQGIVDFYSKGDRLAISGRCAWSSAVPSKEECDAMRLPKGQGLQANSRTHAAGVAPTVSKWSWGGVVGFSMKKNGDLVTPWGSGTWGALKNNARSVWAEFVGSIHLIKFEKVLDNEFGMFVSVRCGDGDIVVGRQVD